MSEADCLWGVIARLRRNQSHNKDTHLVCDALEQALKDLSRVSSELLTAREEIASLRAAKAEADGMLASAANTKPKTDRRAYQRDLMRRRRAAARQGGAKA